MERPGVAHTAEQQKNRKATIREKNKVKEEEEKKNNKRNSFWNIPGILVSLALGVRGAIH